MPDVEENKTVDIDTSGPDRSRYAEEKDESEVELKHQVKKKRKNLPRTKRLKTNVRLN